MHQWCFSGAEFRDAVARPSLQRPQYGTARPVVASAVRVLPTARYVGIVRRRLFLLLCSRGVVFHPSAATGNGCTPARGNEGPRALHLRGKRRVFRCGRRRSVKWAFVVVVPHLPATVVASIVSSGAQGATAVVVPCRICGRDELGRAAAGRRDDVA